MATTRIIRNLIPQWVLARTREILCAWRSKRIVRAVPFRKITDKPALVIAPHPDDETLSCGGLVRLKRNAGVPVRIVFLTDGEAVSSGLGEESETVIAARHREASNACQALGVAPDSIRWLHLPDGRMPHPGQAGFDEAASALLAEIETFEPSEVYCPHWLDVHPDHIAASYITRHALRLWNRPCTLFCYPVWMWYHSPFGLRTRLNTSGAWLLDVARVQTDKNQGMAAYLDAPRTSRGLRYCGDLPQGFLRNFYQNYEVFFDGDASNVLKPKPGRNLGAAARIPKALFFNPGGAVYGSERSMLALLRARKFAAEVVCPGSGVLEQELKTHNVKHHALEFNRFAVWQNPLWHLQFYLRAKAIMKESQPDVVVVNLAGNTPLVTLAAVRSGIRVVRILRFEFKPPTRWFDNWAWRQFSAIICPSETVKRQVLTWGVGRLSGQVSRLYDSYCDRVPSAHEVAEFRQKFHAGQGKTIGYVGRMDRAKHIETAISAFAIVRERFSTARLLVVGGATANDEIVYRDELEHLVADLGLAESVIFTGFMPAVQMPGVFASLNVCVLPSESESFGMVLMEAWAQGVPTVASNVSGCAEISVASGGGLLAPVGDAGAFARAVIQLLLDPDAATVMGQKGKAWVGQNCDSASYAAAFESVINACS